MAHFYRAPSPQDQKSVVDEMRNAGAPDDVIRQFTQIQEQEHFEVLPHNWEALCWFFDVHNLWRWSYVNGQRICDGLDWLQVESESRLSGVNRTPDDFSKLKLAANTAAKLINGSGI